jgi:hypothetical protein
MALPLATIVPFSSSTVIVPWNWPWMESRRSSEARLTMSWAPPPRTTMDQQPGDEAADAAEAVEDDIARLAALDLVGAGGAGHRLGGELLDAQAAFVGLVHGGQHAEVDLGRPEVEGGEGLEERHGLGDRQLGAGDLPGEAVGLQDADHRLVHQGAAVQQDGHVPLAVQLPDERDHRLRDLFADLPVGERVVVDSHRSIFRARQRSYDNHMVVAGL